MRNLSIAPSAPPQVTAAATDKRPRHSHIFKEDQFGHYVEPQWVSARLFQVVDFGPPRARVFDPACGWGRIPASAAAAGFSPIGADIVYRGDDPLAYSEFLFTKADFLAPYAKIPPTWAIVTNPPFRHVRAFTERAVELATYKAAILIPLRRLPAARWLNQLPLEAVLVLTPRPSMPPAAYLSAGHKPGEGKQDFAWLVFSKQTCTGREPRLRWLHRDGGQR